MAKKKTRNKTPWNTKHRRFNEGERIHNAKRWLYRDPQSFDEIVSKYAERYFIDEVKAYYELSLLGYKSIIDEFSDRAYFESNNIPYEYTCVDPQQGIFEYRAIELEEKDEPQVSDED